MDWTGVRPIQLMLRGGAGDVAVGRGVQIFVWYRGETMLSDNAVPVGFGYYRKKMGCRSVVSAIFRSERTDIGNFLTFARVDLVVVVWVVGPIAIAVLVGD